MRARVARSLQVLPWMVLSHAWRDGPVGCKAVIGGSERALSRESALSERGGFVRRVWRLISGDTTAARQEHDRNHDRNTTEAVLRRVAMLWPVSAGAFRRVPPCRPNGALC